MSTRSFRGIRIIRFGDFELDVRAAELRKQGLKVRLQEQPFRILAMLLERPGEVVLREEIRRRLWPNDTVVEVGHGINAAVLRLREALGESAENPRYIETLARRGYRFAGEAEIVFRNQPEAVREPRTPAANDALDSGNLTGRTISHFQVLEQLGVGGMGVVYRAEDLKLGRQVALKFLPRELACDPAALGRFEREARAASALNHPNICTIYGVEECSGQPVIVMELLEGETLEARLAKGPLPLDKALVLAIQMAGALDGAHRKGIVHRDLKPGNVLVTKSGVKVLDFGLAKMPGSIAAGNEAARVTREGEILGTLHYMSPEQAQGRDAGAGSDIFSFGVVLYEMLTGRQAFSGDNAASVMAAILTAEPLDWPEPPVVGPLLRRCLAKDPEDRWQSASDLKASLEWIATGWNPAPARSLRPPVANRLARRWYWIAAGLAAVLLGTATYRPAPPLSTVTVPPIQANPGSKQASRFTISAPDGITRLNLSPDGRSLAYVSGGRVFVRSLDSVDAHPLEASRKAGTPFWSADGRMIAFTDGGKLKTISVAGGTASALWDVNTNLAGAWGPDGAILIGLIGDGIFRVPVAGGSPTRVTAPDPSRGETRHLLPQFLPDGRRFLFLAGSSQPNATMLYAGSLDSSERTPIMPMNSNVTYVGAGTKGSPGYLVFVRDRTLMAQKFDPVKLRTAGEVFPIGLPVSSAAAMGAAVEVADFSAAGGTLAYRSMGVQSPGITIVQNWMAGFQSIAMARMK